MTKYLIVAHQTAESEELREQIGKLASEKPEAEFTLLVPATPIDHLLVWEEHETEVIAERRAASARQTLMADGIKLTEIRVGDPNPYNAVADELLRKPDYTALVVATLPAHASHWLRMDLISRLRRHPDGREIIHVVAMAKHPAVGGAVRAA